MSDILNLGGQNPIGTIISYMGTTAPLGYLACDNTTYNIADYPDLANHFQTQFGTKNYFGGNGTTTFKCPDLRGEFLRGTGTNGHTNEGAGANVGVHQGATYQVNSYSSIAGKWNGVFTQSTSGDGYTRDNKCDYSEHSKSVVLISGSGRIDTYDWLGAYPSMYKARPTNTSVLYCIKY